ncbi:protein Aster-C isoform X3 [Takifugu flavidus]|uniref:protein Aster-C isoform X3 n=1 Tax=Takifugu flavidus TaxID=433684 RepID=UPI0025440344|nr:protein Aster-C isoform X3 [Takifugu flavidus]
MSSTCSLAAEEMDQGPNRSALGSDDVTDESTSLVEVRWSSGDESSDNQSQCLAAPQTPLINYKYRLDEFKKLFKDLPETERLIGDYPCALQRDILLQGRLYLSESWLCFYSQVFRGTKITLAFKDVVNITREKTARWIPNAVQVCTAEEKFFFTSFPARNRTYQDVFRMWQNNLVNKRLTCLEFWHMIRQHYGHELGLNHEEMESLQTPTESSMQTSPSTRTSADEVLRRLEHPSYLRLSGLEHSPVDSSTPQGEDLPSPLSSHNSPSMQDDYHNVPTQPVLERLGLDPPSKHSSLSLDLNANEDVSEQSGSESIEDLDEGVGLSDVQGRLYVNKMFHISANKMFELLFTDSTFMRRFMDIRKIFNIGSTAWQKDSSGNTKRNLTYTVTINNPLVGKFSAATENQTLYKESRDGHYYLVDTEVYTHDVPYHDYFYVHNRYYIIRSSKRRCRLRVYTNVKYKKQPWGLVKSFITKNSWGSIEENFRQLEAELLEEEAAMSQGGGEPGKSGLRRRRRTYSRTLPEHLKSGKQYGQESNQHRDGKIAIEKKGPRRWNTTTIVAWMSLILLILTLMNVGLFFKLWAMEDITHRMYMRTKHRLRERAEASMIPEYGPRQAPGSTREDAQLLRTVLQDSINLLEQLRSSLLVLQQNFALANRTAAPQ